MLTRVYPSSAPRKGGHWTNPEEASCRLEAMNEEQIDFVEKLLFIEQEAIKLAENLPAGTARGRVR